MKNLKSPVNEGEAVTVCLPVADGNPGGYDNNVSGICSECGLPIHWRPHAPPGPKVCMHCFRELREEGDEVMITPKSKQELREWMMAEAEVAWRARES